MRCDQSGCDRPADVSFCLSTAPVHRCWPHTPSHEDLVRYGWVKRERVTA